MISTLDQLILDVARSEVARPRVLAILDDPSGDLLRSSLAAQSSSGLPEKILVGSRTIFQARSAVGIAEDVGARSRVLIAGIDGPLRLDEFFAEPCNLAIGHVPKSLEEIGYISGALCEAGEPTLVIGANNKHMSRGHNAELERYFSDVYASRGRGKFRALVAGGTPTGRTYRPDVGDTQAGPLFGVGGVFSGAVADHGGVLLAASAVAELKPEMLDRRRAANPWDSWERPAQQPRTSLDVVDLGCGNGAVALAILDAFPEATVVATDAHADAITAATLTLGDFVDSGRARITWDDAAGTEPGESADVVMLNPPFHTGNAMDATLVQGLLDAAARILRPGGRLYMVHNNHLRYRPEVEDRFSNVVQLARNPKFTVLRGVK